MSSPVLRSHKTKPTRISPFFRDLASPIPHNHRAAGRFASPGQPPSASASASALWRDPTSESSATVEPPPPPIFTLDDRADLSTETVDLPPLSPRPDFSSSPSLSSSPFALGTRAEVNDSGEANGRGNSPERPVWMCSSAADGEKRDMDPGSPVDGVVEHGVLLALPPPPPKEVPRLVLQGYDVQNGRHDFEEWVTVFGFSMCDTNMVLREFERCGAIVKHILGPRDANWIHILYQNPYDAQKALKKNGIQLNNMLIVGVKRVDPMHHPFLEEAINKINRGGFMVSLPQKSGALNSSITTTSGLVARSYNPKMHANFSNDAGHHGAGSVAIPAKSILSKAMDLMFGI